jgi:hypothetical protein
LGAGLCKTGSPLAPQTGVVRTARAKVSSIYRVFPIGNARDSRPGPDGSRARQDKGFMSTQRREDPRQYRNCTDLAKGSSRIWLVFIAWLVRAIARVGTAPPRAIDRLPAVRLATNSLQLGHRNTKLVRQDSRRRPHSPPPIWAARSAITGTPATRRSSLPLTPAPSVLESLHPSLPKNPAGKCRWTERYDGKRDLHFQYAA